MTALVLVSAAAVVALVELTIRARRHRPRHRRGRRDDRGTTTYWYGHEPITRQDHDAMSRLFAAQHPTNPTAKDHP